jgi:hypothetical protein
MIIPMAVDLSHWDPADDYEAVKRDDIVGVIYKATEGQSYTDDTYVGQQRAAKAAGLRWGSYHFADGSSVGGQINNYLRFAAPDPDELICLDWEDNPSGNGPPAQLVAEWATGSADRPPGPQPEPDEQVVNVLISQPPGVVVKTRILQFGTPVSRDRRKEAGVE